MFIVERAHIEEYNGGYDVIGIASNIDMANMIVKSYAADIDNKWEAVRITEWAVDISGAKGKVVMPLTNIIDLI